MDLPTGGLSLVVCGHLSGGYGNAGMRPERRLSCRLSYSGLNALNPRGSGTESPAYDRVLTPDRAKVISRRQLFIPESAILFGEELP
jgi:hypothetical protein